MNQIVHLKRVIFAIIQFVEVKGIVHIFPLSRCHRALHEIGLIAIGLGEYRIAPIVNIFASQQG